MTIEVRELVIRAIVEGRPARAQLGTAEPALPGPPPASAGAGAPFTAEDREAVVARCVREVLRELRKSRGR